MGFGVEFLDADTNHTSKVASGECLGCKILVNGKEPGNPGAGAGQ